MLFPVVYYLIRYRKDVVLNNLQKAFPDTPPEELENIRKKFYRHFIDITLESLKTFGMSTGEMKERFHILNPEVINEITRMGQSVIVQGSHYANWEWSLSINMYLNVPGYAVYTKINNPYFEKEIIRSRAKFGAKLVVRSDTIQLIKKNYDNKTPAVYGFLSDQSPQLHKAHYWTYFLGVRVPVHTGAEMLAKRYQLAWVYMHIRKIERGYYEVEFEKITTHPNEYPDYTLTDRYLKMVEKQIRNAPEYYLWTHKRFKHEGKEKEV
jgi:KDO2-lipid IV(A) lauroyltransferase